MTARNRRAMAEAERRWLEPDPEPAQCNLKVCRGPFCTLRGQCPDPDKLADELYDRREE